MSTVFSMATLSLLSKPIFSGSDKRICKKQMKTISKNDEGSCVKCGTCNTVCPVYQTTGNEVHTPRGKQHLKPRIKQNEISSHYGDIFSKCLLCGACREICPRGLDTPELVINVRSELPRLTGLTFLKYVSRKALVHPSLLSGLTRIGTTANMLLGEWLPKDSGLRLRLQGFKQEAFKLPAKGYIEKLKTEVLESKEPRADRVESSMSFFMGCLANHLQPEIADATQFLVAKTTGCNADVPLGQTCCGMAAMAAGRIDEARDLAKKNILAFEGNDFPILTSCSSCYYQLKSYNELFEDDPGWEEKAVRFTDRLQEFSTFFLEKLSAISDVLIPADTVSNKKVLYHDPCHLRFKLHITREPRLLIKLLPGIELQELPNGPQCCGQGGLFQVAHPDLAQQVQERLMDDYAKLSAQTVLTACSGCLLQWQLGLASGKKDEKAEHPAIFIAKHLQ
jgi:glycolate oxidase iron-sulfur subunit